MDIIFYILSSLFLGRIHCYFCLLLQYTNIRSSLQLTRTSSLLALNMTLSVTLTLATLCLHAMGDFDWPYVECWLIKPMIGIPDFSVKGTSSQMFLFIYFPYLQTVGDLLWSSHIQILLVTDNLIIVVKACAEQIILRGRTDNKIIVQSMPLSFQIPFLLFEFRDFLLLLQDTGLLFNPQLMVMIFNRKRIGREP